MASKNIESVLLEERSFPPPPGFAAQAGVKPADLQRLREAAAADNTQFWADLARRELTWHAPFTVSLDDSRAPNYRWFTDGRLNVSFNCLDIHLQERGHKTAIIFEGEAGDSRRLSYRELHAEVCRFARALKAQGIRSGDRVVIYMPLIPEVVIAMHACNRIGAIHSVVFGGFSAPALKDRIVDTEARLVITADGGWRAGNVIELKAAADKALASGCPSVERMIVFRRTGRPVSMDPKRDLWWHDAINGQPPACEPEWVDAEHPLFLLYTSGSTGKPKGIQHSSGGYLLGAKVTTKWVFDLRDDDVFWCTADVGWVTGHSYVAYGPLAAGATVVLYEGAPTTPDPGRFWKICQTHRVSIFYTAPTAIRALMKQGEEWPARYDLSRLRVLGTVGEPINPEAWMWYHRVIGQGRCPIVDTWWQTETGAILISPVPGATATKPGSCTQPLPGIDADIVDEDGKLVTRPEAGGYLVIRKPWPFMLRTLWHDNDRYISAYWQKFQNRYYVAGDSARRDKDGYFWIMGRIDDVLNVAGHRLGTMEIESALVSHPRVAEAAVVGKQHEIKGEAVFAYVVFRGQRPTGDTLMLVEELRNWVAEQLGAIARPDEIRFADNLPKTRSGKIMRRLLRSIARGEQIVQDVSTLENPGILDQLRGVDPGVAGPAGPAPAGPAPRKTGGRKSARRRVSSKSATAKSAGRWSARRRGSSKLTTAKSAGTPSAHKRASSKLTTAKSAGSRSGLAKRSVARKSHSGRPAPSRSAGRKSELTNKAARDRPRKTRASAATSGTSKPVRGGSPGRRSARKGPNRGKRR